MSRLSFHIRILIVRIGIFVFQISGIMSISGGSPYTRSTNILTLTSLQSFVEVARVFGVVSSVGKVDPRVDG